MLPDTNILNIRHYMGELEMILWTGNAPSGIIGILSYESCDVQQLCDYCLYWFSRDRDCYIGKRIYIRKV